MTSTGKKFNASKKSACWLFDYLIYLEYLIYQRSQEINRSPVLSLENEADRVIYQK